MARPTLDFDIAAIHSAIIDVAKEQGASLALLFGSFGRGDYSRRSDIDVIYVEDTEERFLDRIGRYLFALRDRSVLNRFDVDVLVYTPDEFKRMQEDENRFILRALREGKILYER